MDVNPDMISDKQSTEEAIEDVNELVPDDAAKEMSAETVASKLIMDLRVICQKNSGGKVLSVWRIRLHTQVRKGSGTCYLWTKGSFLPVEQRLILTEESRSIASHD